MFYTNIFWTNSCSDINISRSQGDLYRIQGKFESSQTDQERLVKDKMS